MFDSLLCSCATEWNELFYCDVTIIATNTNSRFTNINNQSADEALPSVRVILTWTSTLVSGFSKIITWWLRNDDSQMSYSPAPQLDIRNSDWELSDAGPLSEELLSLQKEILFIKTKIYAKCRRKWKAKMPVAKKKKNIQLVSRV